MKLASIDLIVFERKSVKTLEISLKGHWEGFIHRYEGPIQNRHHY
jgi:hypothetical protein